MYEPITPMDKDYLFNSLFNAISHGDKCGWGLNGLVHLPGFVEMIYERAILITDPKTFVTKDYRLGVQGDSHAAWASIAKAVTGKITRGEVWKVGEGKRGSGVESGEWVTRGIGEED